MGLHELLMFDFFHTLAPTISLTVHALSFIFHFYMYQCFVTAVWRCMLGTEIEPHQTSKGLEVGSSVRGAVTCKLYMLKKPSAADSLHPPTGRCAGDLRVNIFEYLYNNTN